MSYILAALEKADKERRKKRGLSLDSLTESGSELAGESRPKGRNILLLGILGVALALVLAWQISSQQSPQVEAALEPAISSTTPRIPAVELPVQHTTVAPADELPQELTVEGIVFIQDQPSRSRVFIQGRGYRVGDLYSSNTRILSINETEITLSNGTTTQSYPIP